MNAVPGTETGVVDEALRHERYSDLLRDQIVRLGKSGRLDTIDDSDAASAAVSAITDLLGLERPIRLAPGGSPPYRVRALLRSVGVVNRLVKVAPGWSRRLDGPVVAFAGDDRTPIALAPSSDGVARRLIDGTAVDENDVASRIVVVQPGIPDGVATPADLYRHVGRGIGRNIAVAVAGLVLAAVAGLVLPMAAGVLFSDIVPFDQSSRLAILAPVLIAVSLSVASITWWAQRQLMRGRALVDRRIAVAMWDRVLALPASFFSGRSVSEVSAIVHAPGRLHGSVPDSILVTGVAGVIGLVNLAFIARQGVGIAVMIVVITVGTLWAIIRINMGSRRHVIDLVASRVRTQGFLRQMVEAVGAMRVSASEARLVHHWARLLVDQQTHSARLMSRDLRLRLALTTLPMLGALVLVLGGPSAPSDGGGFVAMYVAMNQAIGATAAIGASWAAVVRVSPVVDQLRPALRATPEAPPKPRPPVRLSGRIDVDDVTFGYALDRPPVFANLSFSLEQGSMVALVGPSGAGKSTLLRLLLGFERPTTGVIRFDEHPLHDLDPVDFRRQIGVVLQQARLLPGSVRTNIAAGRNLSDDDVWDAVQRASLEDDIRSMPMGLETIVSEGASTLSGGQRQRIIIARALAGNPSILLFDEATSALDNISQARVTASLDDMAITRLVIAHRLSTIRHADRILVLSQGRIVEQGSYDELIDAGGPFTDLARRQLT